MCEGNHFVLYKLDAQTEEEKTAFVKILNFKCTNFTF